ncbi:hypothetical protein BV210_17090 [Halorientalis sp. IM1011]|uniref:DUF1641 domain-containing protein n=1 Tax=Halorientalis sp. IM1011 TaxID=1932360 RepID=UPI00097CCBE9|nr:DUF1641 domain-containing protein [Halorientalis sp. IM1011]AQL44592.1 hypothetical protein BV210_17090 [Halorientalis sp. IM1011]
MAEQQQDETGTDEAAADVDADTGPADAGGDLPPEVREAVAEHPEEVARFLDNLGEVNDLLDGTAVATSAMDDEMVQNLAATGTNLGAAADGLATPEAAQLGEAAGENAGDLAEAIETLARLQRSGTLDDVLALADTLSLLTAAMDDEMVQNLTATGSRLGELADTAADEDVAGSLESVLEAVGEAGDQPAEPPGVVGMVKAMRDPDVQSGMGFMLAVARALGQDLNEK